MNSPMAVYSEVLPGTWIRHTVMWAIIVVIALFRFFL